MNDTRKMIDYIIDKLEEADFIVHIHWRERFFEIETWTDVGENVLCEVEFDYEQKGEDILRTLRHNYEYFDIEEDIEVYLPYRGIRGVPSSIVALYESAQEKGELYEKMYKVTQKAIEEYEFYENKESLLEQAPTDGELVKDEEIER